MGCGHGTAPAEAHRACVACAEGRVQFRWKKVRQWRWGRASYVECYGTALEHSHRTFLVGSKRRI